MTKAISVQTEDGRRSGFSASTVFSKAFLS